MSTFSVGAPEGSLGFPSSPIFSTTPIPSVTFDTAGMVTLRCDIHEHMRAVILVLDTPHFVVTDPDGAFRLPDVPPGRYVLKAWIDSRTTREIPVVVADGALLRVDFP